MPAVTLGNQVPLNTARVPFARYINTIHERIHPAFAEVLTAFEQSPQAKPLAPDLVTGVEMVIEQRTGKLARMGIVRPSGAEAFDRAVLDAIRRAQPFPPAPDVIASPDGRVYLHWEFHRDPFDACSTRNVRPFLLKLAPVAK